MSSKKMHPPIVIHSTVEKVSLLPVSGGKLGKDRQNVENIVPSQNGLGGGGGGVEVAKKANSKTMVVLANLAKPQSGGNSSAISTLNSTNRRKTHRNSSPNRKRQEQQNIFNNLKAWNVKIAPSVPQTPVVLSEDRREFGGIVDKRSDKGEVRSTVAPSAVVNGGDTSKVHSESNNYSSKSSGISGVNSNAVPVSVNSNTSSNSSVSNSISNSNNNIKSKKQQHVQAVTTTGLVGSKAEPEGTAVGVKKKQQHHQQDPPDMVDRSNQGAVSAVGDCKRDSGTSAAAAPPTSNTAIKGGSSVSHTAKGEKKLLNTAGSFSANHRHPATASSLLSSTGPTIPSSSTVASLSSSHSTVTAPVVPSSSSSSPITLVSQAVVTSTKSVGGGTGGTSRSSNAGKVLLPNVNPLSGAPLDPIALIQGKLRSSMKLDNIVATTQAHHIPHHHSTHTHHQGQGQQHHGQQHPLPPPPTSPHYSLEFLHYVGMRMSPVNGTTSQSANLSPAAGPTAMFRGAPHFNFNNFNQQLHQQQIIQQHAQQQQHPQQQQQHQQQQQQQQPHIQRHYQHYYNCDDLLIHAPGGGEPIYTSYGISDHHTSGNGAGTASDAAMAFCYAQSHQHHHSHHHNHPPHQQQQPFGNGVHQHYHQNNNYQQHNRNYSRGGQAGQQNGNGNLPNGNKKSWNNNWHNNKKGAMIQGKYGHKNTGYNSYRKSYHYYNNHHTNGNHHYEYQNQQPEHLRNLVYVKGYDRSHGAPPSQESVSRSPTPSPQSESPAIDTGDGEHADCAATVAAELQDEKSDSGIEEVVRKLKKSGAVPSSSSSSSSMVSIPSADSSAVLSSASQNLNLDLHCGTGQGYESDSSHSSSYNSLTYRHRKYASGGQVYRSSSSTSSGVSSTATFPPHNSDSSMQSSASATNTPTVTNSQVADFFLRSQSYHSSHQNLTAISGSASPNPPDSPVGTPRSLVGTQSMPMFSELFTGQHSNHPPPSLTRGQHSIYASNHSLELTVQTGGSTGASSQANSNTSNCSIASNASSSGYGSAPASTVPPNEAFSMQSGHPKRRYSGRLSPTPLATTHKPTRISSTHATSTKSAETVSSHQQTTTTPQLSPTSRKHQHPVWDQHRPATVPVSSNAAAAVVTSTASMSHPPPALPPAAWLHPHTDGSFLHTPADRFLARAHLVELLSPPEELAPSNSKWRPLSTAIWDKFSSAQQTQHKFVQKIYLWKNLFMWIRKAFPRFSLYLVGSTISGFASDSSDVDMCLVCRSNPIPFDVRGEALFQLGQVKNYFMNISTYFEDFSVIQAKVPILRFQDSANSIVVDLNYNNCVGIRNTHLLYCYSQMDWRLRPLTLVVKLWAQHHNINDAKNMTISSYSLVLMVIHFMQYGVSPPILPCLHALYPDKFVECPTLQRMADINNLDLTETVEPYKNDNKQTLGELFVRFLEYYANFDYAQYAISVRTASVIPIETARAAGSYKNDPHHWRQLCIEEPFDLTNTARSVFDADIFEQIKSVFSTCWQRLKETNDLSSVFECEPLFIPVASTLSLTS